MGGTEGSSVVNVTQHPTWGQGGTVAPGTTRHGAEIRPLPGHLGTEVLRAVCGTLAALLWAPLRSTAHRGGMSLRGEFASLGCQLLDSKMGKVTILPQVKCFAQCLARGKPLINEYLKFPDTCSHTGGLGNDWGGEPWMGWTTGGSGPSEI